MILPFFKRLRRFVMAGGAFYHTERAVSIAQDTARCFTFRIWHGALFFGRILKYDALEQNHVHFAGFAVDDQHVAAAV